MSPFRECMCEVATQVVDDPHFILIEYPEGVNFRAVDRILKSRIKSDLSAYFENKFPKKILQYKPSHKIYIV